MNIREDPRNSTAMQIDKILVQTTAIPKERHIPPERQQQINDELEYYNYKYKAREWSIRGS